MGDEINIWSKRIGEALNREKTWRDHGEAVVERYRDEAKEDRKDIKHRYNVLYANTSVLQPAIFSTVPRPDVRRMFPDANPVALQASEIIERCLIYYADSPLVASALRRARDDFLLPGRGTVRIKYEADIEEYLLIRNQDGSFVGEDGVPVEPDRIDSSGNGYIEFKGDERVICEHVFWKDFVHDNAKSWEDVTWVAFRVTFSEKEAKEFFGRNYDKLLNLTEEDDASNPRVDKEYEVWEVWDKTEKKRLWVSLSRPEIVDEEDDPLGLEDFFPCPRPMIAIETTDSMVPVPLFRQYESQAVALDEVANRRARIVRAMKLVGWYAGDKKDEVAAFEQADDGDLIPVKVFDKGPREAIAWNPIEHGAAAINQLMLHQADLESKVFQISGISDIMRGDTHPRESAAAQRLKASGASLRLRPLREQMEEFVRDMFRLAGEVIAEKFSPEKISRISGISNPQALALLKDQKMRDYAIDIETDATVQPDAQLQKQELAEFVGVLSPLLQQVTSAAQAFPPSAPALLSILGAVVRQYNVDPKIEEGLTALGQQIVQAAGQPKGPSETEIQEKAETERVMMRERTKMMQGQANMVESEKDRDLEAKKIALEALSGKNSGDS